MGAKLIPRAWKDSVTIADTLSTSDRILSFRYGRTIKKEGGMWVAKSRSVNFAAYGKSKADALFRLHRGITLVVISLRNRRGLDGVTAWLDSRGIRHSFSSEIVADREVVLKSSANAT